MTDLNPGDDPTIAFETSAEDAVTADFAEQVSAVIQTLLSAFFALEAISPGAIGDELERFRATAMRMLLEMKPSMAGNLAQAIEQGRGLGVQVALDGLGAGQARSAALALPVPELEDRTLNVVAEQIDDRAMRRLHEAASMARTMPPSLDGIAAVAGQANMAVTAARSDVRWSTNRAINLGGAGVAKALDWRVLWVAERNACLQCLAYSGLVVKPGQLFPGGLSFGKKTNAPPTAYPPRHPNCRCRVEPYDGPDAAREGFSGNSPADALRREARRSVLRGFSGYASEPARLRAAEQLLKQGAELPKTVIERARRDVRRGKFNARRTKG